jgi:hypothetical protein
VRILLPAAATLAAAAVLASDGLARPPTLIPAQPAAQVADIGAPATAPAYKLAQRGGESAATRLPSTGQVVMPDLINDTVGQAELTVRGVGLSFCPPAREATPDRAEVGRVMGQSPPAGAVVPTGTKVIVIVGTTEQPDAHPASVWHAPIRSMARIEPLPPPPARPSP